MSDRVFRPIAGAIARAGLLMTSLLPVAASAQTPVKQPLMVPGVTYCANEGHYSEAEIVFHADGRLVTKPKRGGRPEEGYWRRGSDGRLCVEILRPNPYDWCFDEVPHDVPGGFALAGEPSSLEFVPCGGDDFYS